MRQVMVILIAIMIVVAGSAVMADNATTADMPFDDDPPGRVVANRGVQQTLSGTLRWDRDEWYLATGSTDADAGALYELHLGPYGHRAEPVFTDGASAVADGFVYNEHMAPISVDTGGETHRFWNTDRMPMWAGSGEGGGRVAQTNPEIPVGQRLAVQGEEPAPGRQTGPRAFAGPGTGQDSDGVERGFRNEPPGVGRFRN